MNSGIDYRKTEIAEHGDTYVLKNSEQYDNPEERFEQLLHEITGIKCFSEMSERNLRVFGRNFKVPRAIGRVCLFTFKELCDAPLGAQDYIEMADEFDVIFIKDLQKWKNV